MYTDKSVMPLEAIEIEGVCIPLNSTIEEFYEVSIIVQAQERKQQLLREGHKTDWEGCQQNWIGRTPGTCPFTRTKNLTKTVKINLIKTLKYSQRYMATKEKREQGQINQVGESFVAFYLAFAWPPSPFPPTFPIPWQSISGMQGWFKHIPLLMIINIYHINRIKKTHRMINSVCEI